MFYFFIGKPFFQSIEDHINADETGGFVDGGNLQLGSPARSSPHSQGSDNGERFSRKVFVGGLPPDIDEGKFYQFKMKIFKIFIAYWNLKRFLSSYTWV